MKSYTSLVLLLSLVLMLGCQEEEALPILEEASGTSNGTAIIITGAAARITQELALLEALDNQGRLNNVRFISGVSSGAINTVMLNAVLDRTNDFGWQEYKDLVLNLNQTDILTNEKNNLPVNTIPLYNTFENTFTNRLGYSTMADLPFNSAVTATRLDLQELVFASNVPGLSDFDGGITEVIMSSASFPIAFPSIKIDNNIYVDGGLEENIPVRAAIQFQLEDNNMPFDTVYVVSYQKNLSMDWDQELDFLGIRNTRKNILETSLEKAGFNTDAFSQASFIQNLRQLEQEYPVFARNTFVYIPEIENLPYYGVFDFSSETATSSYNIVSNWAITNLPVTLEDYLESQN